MKLILKRILAIGIIAIILGTIVVATMDKEYSVMIKMLYFLAAIAIILWVWLDLWEDRLNKQNKQAAKIIKEIDNVMDEIQKQNDCGKLECVHALLETNTAQTEQEACKMLKIDYDEFLLWKSNFDEKSIKETVH